MTRLSVLAALALSLGACKGKAGETDTASTDPVVMIGRENLRRG